MRARAVTTLLCLFVGLCSGAAQEPLQATNAAGTEPVTLDVVVTQGKNGKPIAGLPQSDFTVLDRGTPQPISSFRALNGATDPVKVLLVVDAVNLDFTRLAYERGEIDRFLRANEGRLAQPTSLAIVTDTTVSVEPGFSTDGNQLAEQFDKQVIGLRILRRNSGFFGAAERFDISLKALDQLLAHVAPESGRKFMIWMSPGWPLLSGPNIELSAKEEQALYGQVIATSNSLRHSSITLYTVDPLGSGESPGRAFYFEQFLKGVTKPSEAYPADLGAQVLSVQSGGQFLSGSNDLAGLVQRCVDDASAAYEITYTAPPAESANEYHKIEVRMAEPHQVARTRQGYITPSPRVCVCAYPNAQLAHRQQRRQ